MIRSRKLIALSLWCEEVERGRQRGLTRDEAAREAVRRLANEPEFIGGREVRGPADMSKDGCPQCGDARILPTGRCWGRGHHAGLGG